MCENKLLGWNKKLSLCTLIYDQTNIKKRKLRKSLQIDNLQMTFFFKSTNFPLFPQRKLHDPKVSTFHTRARYC